MEIKEIKMKLIRKSRYEINLKENPLTQLAV